MTKLFLLLGLSSLLVCAGCGSGNGGSSNNFHPQGNFSQGSLNGQYTYQMTGWDLGTGNPISESGTFTADGKGNITAGTDDSIETGLSTNSFTGTYNVVNDGTGTLTMSFNGGSAVFAITLISSSQLYFIEQDGNANAYGTAVLQNTSALSATPSGTFAFRIHSLGTEAMVGAFTVSGGTVSGSDDVWPGSGSSLTLTGSFGAPGVGGRGTGTFTDSTGTQGFIYYIVDANTIHFLLTNSGVIGVGGAEMQSGTFNTAAFTGGYAFGSRGDTANFLEGIQTVGRFTAGGDGTISNGAYDYAQDGVNQANATLTGTYTITSNGRVVLNLTSSVTGTFQETLWMVNPTRAFFLVNNPSTIEDGTMDAQQGSSFTNATMNGQYAFVTDGFNTNVLLDQVGTLIFDGKGGLSLSEFSADSSGNAAPLAQSGTYAMDSSGNGRGVGSINNVSNNLVFYAVSPNSGYILQNDAGTEISGMMTIQQ